MPISIPQTAAATSTSLSALADKYGKLPADYISFLGEHDGATPQSNIFEGDERGISVRQFLPATEIIAAAREIEGLKETLIPIAFDDCGNYVCIGAIDHKIYFWDHEIDNDTIIANSFDQLLERLRPFDLSEVQLKPGQVRHAWINPKFKPEF
jgi:SMI1-KNR4 cell-wall